MPKGIKYLVSIGNWWRIFMVNTWRGNVIFMLTLILLGLGSEFASAQVVVIARDGFPYCEPFDEASTRANTVLGGSPNSAILTSGKGDPSGNGVLRLTTNDPDQTGYVFVDLPFSSAYGIKTSFEYFAYNAFTPGDPGDGFSFFLFDGSIGPNDNIPPSNPNEFEIGGLGGSLGYSPLRYSGGSFAGGYGLKGAYMGIGLDERGNWGNQYEGRLGGFEAPYSYGSGLSPLFFPRYPNSIAIRGPVVAADVVRDNGMTGNYVGFPATFPDPPTYLSYPFIDGKIVFNDPTDPAPFNATDPKYFLQASERFTIGALNRVTDCSVDGYRKVFIDLRPNGAGSYTITMDVLVNVGGTQKVVNIFNNVAYPYGAPQNLKVGFAASTGATLRSVHEIRNVTVEVSSIDPALAPDPPNLNEKVCFDEDLTFDFDVNLPAANQFIRCLQLYENDPGAPDNTPNPAGDPALGNCGLSGVCVDKCKPENKKITIPGVGTYEAILEELTSGNFDDIRNEAKIHFTPEPGFFGTHTIYYTVIDNYGLTSYPRTVTVTVNPFPKIDSSGAIIGPTCNGQNDGSITNVVLKDLVPGYVFSWKDEFGNVLPSSNYSVSETPVGDYLEATVGVDGVNLGRYFLTVSNPATNNICEDVFPFDVIDERGTPVQVVLDDQEVCEGTPVVFEPQLEDPTDAANPTYLWWKDNNKTQPITNGLTEGAVSYSLVSPGVLTIDGLPQSATPYEYYVEVAADPSQNLCATPAGQLRRVQVLVIPPLTLDASLTDDLCRESIGQIVVNANGGFGTFEYSLDGAPFQSSNTFSGLLPGTYTIEVRAGSNCIGTITRDIAGPAEALTINQLSQENPTCGLDNGELTFEISGGTSGYSFTLDGNTIAPQLSGGQYTVTGISPAASHTVIVTDSNNCSASFTTQAFSAVPIPEFDAIDAIICPGEMAILTVQTLEAGNSANLSYSWQDGSGNPINTGTSGGITYSVDSNTGDLTIEGLLENNLPYDFQVVISGDNLCNSDPIPTTVTVNPVPKLESPVITNVLCFGEATGIIEFVPEDAAIGVNYEYSIDGGATWQGTVFGNLSAGLYNFEVRNSLTGCQTTISGIEITEPEELVLDFVEVIDPACGESNGLVEVEFSGGVAPYTISVFLSGTEIVSNTDVSSTQEFRDLAPGDYDIIVIDANGCSSTITQTLTNNDGIPITIDPMSDEICEGDIVEILPVINTSGNPDLTWYKDAALNEVITTNSTLDSDGLVFTVDPSTLELTIDGLPFGNYTYYLVAEGPGYCPNPPFEATVTVFEPISATLSISNEQCFQAADGSIEVNASGSDGSFEYSIDGGASYQASNLFENLSPGNYTIDIRSTGGNGCTFQISGLVEGPQAPISINSPDIIRSSCGDSNGSIENLIISGGWGSYSVEWRVGSETGSIVSTDLKQAIDLLPDTYFVIITDLEGCVFVESFVLEEQPRPEFEITTMEVCAGENVVLTPVNIVSGSSPTELLWYKDAAKTQLIENGSDPSNPTVSYQIDEDGELTISGLEGNANIYNFYLHVVCSDETVVAEALVRVVPDLEFESDPEKCFGAADGVIRVTSGSDSKYLYSVNGGSTIPQSVLESTDFAPGIYSIEVTNNGYCPSIYSVEVDGPDAPLAVEPLTKIDPPCGADAGIIETQITGGWAPYTISVFKNGNSIQTITVDGPDVEIRNLAPGEYYLEVEDSEGCIIVSNTIELVYGPSQIEVDDIEICEGEDAVFVPTVIPSVASPNFQWFRDAAASSEITTSATPDTDGLIYNIAADGTLTVSGLQASASTRSYYVTVSGNGVCPGFVKEVEVFIHSTPTLSYSVAHEVCFGDQGTIILQGGAGNGVYEYSIDGINWQSENTFQVTPGIYSGYVKSGGACSFEVSDIEVLGPGSGMTNTEPIIAHPTCNTTDGTVTFIISGGYGEYSIEYTLDGVNQGAISHNNGLVELENLTSGVYMFTIRDENPDGLFCVHTLSAPIELIDQPTPLTSVGDSICVGETAIISASTTQAGISPVFTWYADANGQTPITSGSSGNVSYQVNSTTGEMSISGLAGRSSPYIYYVGISGNGVCDPGLVPVEVNVAAIPNLRVSNPSIVCDPNGTVDLTQFIEGFNPGLYDYEIESPSGIDMRLEDIDAVNETGSYRVKSSQKGTSCWSPEQRIQVLIAEVELLPEFNYEVDLGGGNILVNAEVQILEPVLFQDLSQGKVVIWNWDFGDGSTSSNQNPTHEFEKKGVYTVTLTAIDELGCIAEYQRVIQVFDDYIIMVPNAFTPDGIKNQYFKPQYRGIASMEFYVFNTWGELIFEANSLETLGWDGTWKGKKVPNGNYVYRATFTTRSGEKVDRSGVFVLIR